MDLKKLNYFLTVAEELSFSRAARRLGIRLNPHPQDAGAMVEGIRSGKLDIAFVGYTCPEIDREFDRFFLYRLPLCVVVAKHHPLAKSESVDLKQFEEFPLISLDAKSFPGRHELITGLCREAGIKPKSTKRVDGLLSALANIANSQAFTIMPCEVQSIATQHVRFIKLVQPDAGVDFHALVKKGESRKIVLTLLNECRRIAGAKYSH